MNGEKTYQEKKEEKERARALAERQRRHNKTLRRVIIWSIGGVVVGGGIWALIAANGPQGQDFSVSYEIQGRNHIQIGEDHPPYNSNPPSSGWHYANPAVEDFYTEELPDEQLVHNLEHGDVWIAYHPRITKENQKILAAFADSKVIVTPREANEFDISLVAWGRVDSFNLENGIVQKDRIRDFIKRYKNKGPERVLSSVHRRR